jgi:hypothetical protein
VDAIAIDDFAVTAVAAHDDVVGVLQQLLVMLLPLLLLLQLLLSKLPFVVVGI